MTDIWIRWGALTRSLISTRIAMDRERSFWEGLSLTNKSQLKLKAQPNGSKVTVRVTEHLAALDDERTVLAASLVLSYALAEAAALDRLGIDSRTVAGVEDWGTRLLGHAGRDWSDVVDGLAGASEVGVVRNLVVHGQDTVDAKSHARLTKSGSEAFQVGDRIGLSYDRVGAYRARLRSLLMVGGLGSE
ncbi:hypothetical protein ARHIZOSPH14_27700 [Agromyces rhizosphaerae]|uniref:Uncharacterized protein n=1 Tax=Agromyces rhizosphaerae TaxID=88374 RepID=A0A9W6CU53_9MICO|nr:hypothetical protein [Agromyces rhizosphaerae]GLI28528.1 hypothetical protein ARHIZOSPH14_27700 [Agromyces rhizosphaerae]